MQILLDCVPCTLRRAVEAPRRFTDDREQQERIVREAAEVVAHFDYERTAPEMGAEIDRIIREVLGDPDPYLAEKRRFNALALELVDELRERIASAEDPFEAAVRVAIAGNVIDFGAPGGRTDGDLRREVEEALTRPIRGGGVEAIQRLREALSDAQDILLMADNAGEIVFDRLLLEQLPPGRVTVVVRAAPVLNDALREDAEVAGLHELAEIIDSGVQVPGTPLGMASPAFRERFRTADLILSKGQGNYETLSDEDAPAYFLLMAKCPAVAGRIGCTVGDFVVALGSAGHLVTRTERG